MYPLEKKYPDLVVTASNYDRKISVELPSDVGLDELFEAFKTIALGLTYHADSWDNHILQLSDDIRDERYRDEQERFHRDNYQDYLDEVTNH